MEKAESSEHKGLVERLYDIIDNSKPDDNLSVHAHNRFNFFKKMTEMSKL